MRKKNHCIFIFLLFSLIAVFAACSQSLPEVRSGSCGLVLEYENMDSYPEVKLSVFLQSSSEVRRYETLSVHAMSSDYSWTVYDVIKSTENKKSFIGYNNLIMPENLKFPTGSYNVTAKTLDDEETELDLNLNYDQSVYSVKGSDVSKFIKNKSYRKKIAAYSEDGYLLFYGPLNGDNSTIQKLAKNYSEATYYNEVYIAPNASVTFIMPKQSFEEENKE